MGSTSLNKDRQSGIELLKIIVMFGIVLNHATMSLTPGTLSPEQGMDLVGGMQSLQVFVLILFRYLGSFGVDVFVIASAWFLVVNSKSKAVKLMTLLVDVWVLSVAMLLIFTALGIDYDKDYRITSFFPTIFGHNWFIGCYVLLVAFHPFLNVMLDHIGQRMHLMLLLGSGFVYCGLCFILPVDLYYSPLIIFVIIYVYTAYCRKYLFDKCNDKNYQRTKLGLAAFFWILFLFLVFLGLVRNPDLNIYMTQWNGENNPLIIMAAGAAFNLSRMSDFVSAKVNYVSSLTLFIYVIHENVIFRNSVRPLFYDYIYDHFGNDCILLWVLLYAIILFVASLLISAIYKISIHRIVSRISAKLGERLVARISSWVDRLMVQR